MNKELLAKKTVNPLSILIFSLCIVCAFVGCAMSHSEESSSVVPSNNTKELIGEKWNLVKFSSMDDTILTPERPEQYSVQFFADGHATAQIDCNRGQGTWKFEAPSGLTFGPMMTTRVGCKPSKLERRFGKDLANVRSFTIKDSKLYLSLMADGGIYEFER